MSLYGRDSRPVKHGGSVRSSSGRAVRPARLDVGEPARLTAIRVADMTQNAATCRSCRRASARGAPPRDGAGAMSSLDERRWRMETERFDVNLFDRSVVADPFPLYEEIRATGRIVRNEALAAWMVPGFDDCNAVFADMER